MKTIKETLGQMSKEQVIHSIIYAMFEKNISLDELTKVIKEKEAQIIESINHYFKQSQMEQDNYNEALE
jgi:hypothetical protein